MDFRFPNEPFGEQGNGFFGERGDGFFGERGHGDGPFGEHGNGPFGEQSARQKQSPRVPRNSSSTTDETIRPLPLTLEDLYCGTVKYIETSRKLLSGRTEQKTLQIQVVPGWKAGTKIRFPKAGSQVDIGGDAPDLVFVVEVKPHPTFTRVEKDLYITLRIPLVDALTNPPTSTPLEPSPLPRTIRTLDARHISIPLPSGVIRPGLTTRIPNEGMPVRAKGVTVGRGDLIIKWFVVYPSALGQEQRGELARILRGPERNV